MADRKSNLLVTMIFDENSDIRKQVDTEHEAIAYIRNGLQHAIVGKEIKHFVIVDDEVINEKLTQERKIGKWIYNSGIQNWECSECGETPKTMGYVGTSAFMTEHFKFCNHCGAEMRGVEMRGVEK